MIYSSRQVLTCKSNQRDRSHLEEPNRMNKQERNMAWEPCDKLRVMKPDFPNKIMGMNIIIFKANLRYLRILESKCVMDYS